METTIIFNKPFADNLLSLLNENTIKEIPVFMINKNTEEYEYIKSMDVYYILGNDKKTNMNVYVAPKGLYFSYYSQHDSNYYSIMPYQLNPFRRHYPNRAIKCVLKEINRTLSEPSRSDAEFSSVISMTPTDEKGIILFNKYESRNGVSILVIGDDINLEVNDGKTTVFHWITSGSYIKVDKSLINAEFIFKRANMIKNMAIIVLTHSNTEPKMPLLKIPLELKDRFITVKPSAVKEKKKITNDALPLDIDNISKLILKKTKDLKLPLPLTITDATANCGENTISFSKYFENVYSFEINSCDCLLKNTQGLNINVFCVNYLKVKNIYSDILFIDYQLYIGHENISDIVHDLLKKNLVKVVCLKVPFNFDVEGYKSINKNTELHAMKKYYILITQ